MSTHAHTNTYIYSFFLCGLPMQSFVPYYDHSIVIYTRLSLGILKFYSCIWGKKCTLDIFPFVHEYKLSRYKPVEENLGILIHLQITWDRKNTPGPLEQK